MSPAREASSGVRTAPVSTMALPAISDLTLEPGTKRLIRSSSALEIGADRNLQRQNLLALRVEEEGIGLADFLGDQEHAVG